MNTGRVGTGWIIAAAALVVIGLAITGSWSLGVPPQWIPLVVGLALVAAGGIRWLIGNDY